MILDYNIGASGIMSYPLHILFLPLFAGLLYLFFLNPQSCSTVGEAEGSCEAAVAKNDGFETKEGWNERCKLGSGRVAKTGQRGDGPIVDGCQLV